MYKNKGNKRKSLKKEIRLKKHLLKSFFYYHQMYHGLANVYNSKTETFPMTDNEAQLVYNNKKSEILDLENQLKEVV